MNPSPIDLREVISSQIPALALLQNMGYTYITPAQALAYRQGKRSTNANAQIQTIQWAMQSVNICGTIVLMRFHISFVSLKS